MKTWSRINCKEDVFKFINPKPQNVKGCLHFYRSVTGKYPRVHYQGIRYRASRLVYILTYGEFDPKLIVRHTCDNVECVNILHLVLGTHQQNTQDMLKRGRSGYPGTKLSADDVAEIHELRKKHWRQREIAAKFNVSRPHISAVLAGCYCVRLTQTFPRESVEV